MPALRVTHARMASIRVRALTAAYSNLNETLRRLDRLERLGRRIGSARIVDLVGEVRAVVIEACTPRLHTTP